MRTGSPPARGENKQTNKHSSRASLNEMIACRDQRAASHLFVMSPRPCNNNRVDLFRRSELAHVGRRNNANKGENDAPRLR